MAFNFPDVPTNGQVFGNYTWDGEKWVLNPGGGSSGGTAATTTFAPAGNIAATDVQAAIVELDTEKLAKTGGTITGNLIVNNDLTCSNYFSAEGGQVNTTLSLLVLPTNPGHATNKTYVDARTPKITVATSAPGSPATNDLWVDTT